MKVLRILQMAVLAFAGLLFAAQTPNKPLIFKPGPASGRTAKLAPQSRAPALSSAQVMQHLRSAGAVGTKIRSWRMDCRTTVVEPGIQRGWLQFYDVPMLTQIYQGAVMRVGDESLGPAGLRPSIAELHFKPLQAGKKFLVDFVVSGWEPALYLLTVGGVAQRTSTPKGDNHLVAIVEPKGLEFSVRVRALPQGDLKASDEWAFLAVTVSVLE